MTAQQQETKVFYHEELVRALESCINEGYRPLFMPELIDQRITLPNDSIWHRNDDTLSLIASGTTKYGTGVVVVAHKPHYLSSVDNFKAASKKLIDGAAIIPQDSFDQLIDSDGECDQKNNRLVYVIDKASLEGLSSGHYAIEQVLEHPLLIPFIGGEQRAEIYLKKHQKEYETGRIGVWYRESSHGKPVGRLLLLSNDYDGLFGSQDLTGSGRFIGVRAEGTTKH